MSHSVLVVLPHADDAAAFCGGTVPRLARAGLRVVLLRVTDDARDSVGLTIEETTRRNAEEFREAARVLGAAETVDLGFPTDALADVPETRLRERIVHALRRFRPILVLGFDPDAPGEGNLDHAATARATEEAFWVAGFDLHHPEHFEEGLRPFVVGERWYFARDERGANHVVDVTETFATRVEAFAAHRTMVRNILNSHRLMLEGRGLRAPMLEAAMDGDPRPMLDMALRAGAAEVARAHGLAEGRLGEAFRAVRPGEGIGAFLLSIAEPIPGRELAPDPIL